MLARALLIVTFLAAPLDSPDAYAVDERDGIDEREANALGHLYYERYVNLGCGAHEKATRSGGSWFVAIAHGYAGELSPVPIVIDAATGAISYAGDPRVAYAGPSFKSASEFLAGR